MGQQELHFVLTRTSQRQRQVFQPDHRVVHAGEPKRISAQINAHTLVNKYLDSFGAKQIGDKRCIGPMIVISQHGEDTVTRTQPANQLRTRGGLAAVVRNVITGERD